VNVFISHFSKSLGYISLPNNKGRSVSISVVWSVWSVCPAYFFRPSLDSFRRCTLQPVVTHTSGLFPDCLDSWSSFVRAEFLFCTESITNPLYPFNK
jgi:hypothetical protein